MAKDSDQLARDDDADGVGGLLGGLLAEEDDLDRRALWRIGSWGVGALAAIIVAVMSNQSSLGWQRDQFAADDLARQAQQIRMAARETQGETRRLASAIDTLNGDRDRLYTRVTGLEQGLESVTGAIARQHSAAVAPSGEPAAVQSPAPQVAPVATTASPATDKPAAKAEAAKESPREIAKADIASADVAKADLAKAEVKATVAKADPVKTDAAKTDLAKADRVSAAKTDTPRTDVARIEVVKADVAKNPADTPSTPLVASKSIMAPPDPAAGKLIETARPASAVTAAPMPEVEAMAPAATDEEADEATAVPKVALQRTEFGVDLGTANSVNGLRALWRGLLKSRSNAALTALRPIIVIKESSNGPGMQLRLVAGPLNDAGAAAKICAAMTENKKNCETAIFDGQRLSMKSDDSAPGGDKSASHKRGASKRASAAEDPPKKPETSTLSSISAMFGRKNTQ